MAHSLETILTRSIVAVASASLIAQAGFAMNEESPLRVGVGIDGGRVSVDSLIPAELDKSGTQFGYRGFVEYQTRWLSLMVGGAQRRVSATGEDTQRGVSQQLNVNAATVQGGLFLNLGRRFSLGMSSRVHTGPSADYGVYADKENHSFRDAGPSLRARLATFKGFDVAAEVSWFKSLENDVRKVDTFVAGLSASIPVKTPHFGRLEFAAKNSPAAVEQKPATIDAKPVVTPHTVDNLAPTSEPTSEPTFAPVLFQHASDALLPDDEPRVAEMIKSLKGMDLKGRQIHVSGHGSRVGSQRATLKVSLARAEKIASMLVAGGIPEDAIDFAGFGASALDPNHKPGADEQRRVVVALKNSGAESPASMSFKISTQQVASGLVYKVDELWTVLEIARSIRRFRAADKSVVIEVPASVIKKPGSFEKASQAVSILKSFGLKSTQITTKVIPLRSDIQIRVASPDTLLIAALGRASERRGRMLVLPVASDKLEPFVARLQKHRNLWSYVEAKPEIRQGLIASGIAKKAVIHRSKSDLWPHAVVGFGPLAENYTLVVVHGNRSLKHLTAALTGDVDKAPIAH